MKELIQQEFKNRFGYGFDFLIRSPGRVNLIGEHTDYNDGFVLPMAIDRSIWMAVKVRDDRKIVLHSVDFLDDVKFSLNNVKSEEGWGQYVSGVAWALQQAGYETLGWEGVIMSDIPIGAGLSSSAALEMAAARTFSIAGEWAFDPRIMARIGQRAENEWVGANTGIMDQTIVASGRAGHALLIDCRDLSTRYVPMPENVSVVILDSATRHAHTDSGYNERREQCEAAAKFLGVSHLRDVTLEEFNLRAAELGDLVSRRSRHVITENQRVLKAVSAFLGGDIGQVGILMNESHTSMRDDFEITNGEIDILVSVAQSEPGCLGARMTGGGFGGCVVSLVEKTSVDEFVVSVRRKYERLTGLVATSFVVEPVSGVECMRFEGLVA